MKIKSIVTLVAALLLTGCSLGAEAVSKSEFKRILTDEIKPTLVTSAKEQAGSYTLRKNVRKIEQKRLNQTVFIAETSDLNSLKNKDAREGELGVYFAREDITYVTKEIVNNAGVKTFSDVEKSSIENYYSLSCSVEDNQHTVVATKEVVATAIHTDYLFVQLDGITGRISDAEIIVDDDIYDLKTKKVTYDTFEKEGDKEEDEDDTPEEVVVSLSETKWTLSDSSKTYKNAVIDIYKGVDDVVSKDTCVGTISYNDVMYELYVFEIDSGSYNFEIRMTDEQIIKSYISPLEVYENNDDAYEKVILPKLNALYAVAEVSEIETSLFNTYHETFDFMVNTIDSNNTIEILRRPSGIVYRIIQNGLYKEILVSKLSTSNTRKITDVVERQGTNGDEITNLVFEGFGA